MQLSTNSKLIVNPSPSFGTAVVFVEGEKDEFTLLIEIFNRLLGNRVIEKRRKKEFLEWEFAGSNSTLIVMNTKYSNIRSISNQNCRNALFSEIFKKYEIDLTNKPVFYLWDRDRCSNAAEDVENAIKIFGNPYMNSIGYMSGLLLLSYPSIEAYKISTIDNIPYPKNCPRTAKNLKKILEQLGIAKTGALNKNALEIAANEMLSHAEKIGISYFEREDFSNQNKDIFQYEESYYKEKAEYDILSLFSIILIYLNILIPASPTSSKEQRKK